MQEIISYIACALLLGLPFQLIFIVIIHELHCSIFKQQQSVLGTVILTLIFFIAAPAAYVVGVTALTTVFLSDTQVQFPYIIYVLSFFWQATYAAKFPKTDDSYNALLRQGPTLATIISFGGYFFLLVRPEFIPALALEYARLVLGTVSAINFS